MGSETEGGALDIHLTYAALVWWTRKHLTTVKKQFGHIQRITCLGRAGCISTTTTINRDSPESTTFATCG
jgi:hypothetical protein